MKKHDDEGGTITFRAYVGYGEYRGCKFELSTAMTPAGDLLGLPVFVWDDGKHTTVTLELNDLLPMAYSYAFNKGDFTFGDEGLTVKDVSDDGELFKCSYCGLRIDNADIADGDCGEGVMFCPGCGGYIE